MNNTGADKPHGGPDRHFASNTIPRMFVENTGDSLAKRNAAAGIDRAMAGEIADRVRNGNNMQPRSVVSNWNEPRGRGSDPMPWNHWRPDETLEEWVARVAGPPSEERKAQLRREELIRGAEGIAARRTYSAA